MIKSRLFLMCGLPASGKSTFAKSIMKSGDFYTSRDEIRFNLVKEDEEYFSKEDEVYDTFIMTINSALRDSKRVFADATHLDFTSRAKILSRLDLKDIEVNVIYMLTPLEECIKRNSRRKGRYQVPEDIIKSMYKKLTIPSINETKIDNVYIVHIGGDIEKMSYNRNILREEI